MLLNTEKNFHFISLLKKYIYLCTEQKNKDYMNTMFLHILLCGIIILLGTLVGK